MNAKTELYRQLLLRSFTSNTSNHCLFCYGNPDSYITRGCPKDHTYHLPFKYTLVDKIVVTYKQGEYVILEKVFDKDRSLMHFKELDFDKSLLFWTLDEEETLRFEVGEPVQIQLKAGFKDTGKVITSQVSTVDVYDTLTPSTFFDDRVVYYALDCRVSSQRLKVRQYLDVVQSSDGLYRCRFFFEPTWSHFSKTATFKDEYNHVVSVDLLETRDNLFECTLPPELIELPGYIYVGVAGVYADDNQEIVKPTLWSRAIRVPKGCLEHGTESMKAKKTNSFVYYGVVDDAYEAKTRDLSILTISRQELLMHGFKWSKYSLDNQYQVIAIPKQMKLKCDYIQQETFTITPTTHEDDDYRYYYFSAKATGTFTSQYIFKEAS